ncbi:hypothetical protein EVAR_100087_1 [Eumeta japonica]|uniref:RNA-directed DNA polymerase from transposon X-element n=1 Tax=Eumeta variegata TaxID=151549 RepID=A0A4C1YY71_EUMVA|nr:hypothetical protein EVAR_100087_1 [Eumeta japonica]
MSQFGSPILLMRTVVENRFRTVPAKSDRRELPRDVSELIRDKNAALSRAGKYLTCENRSRTRVLQRKLKARMKEVRNENWNYLVSKISPSHKAYWGLAKALKTEGAVPTPALKHPDNSIAFDDQEKAECLADIIEHQCSENPSYDLEHFRRVEKKVGTPLAAKHLNVFLRHLWFCFVVLFCGAIFNEWMQNCYFPTAWKETVVIGIFKPRKPRDLPASYRPTGQYVLVNETYQSWSTSRLYALSTSVPRPSTGIQLVLFADDTALYLRLNSIGNIIPRPVMTYVSPVFAHAQPDILYHLQIVQNKFCRRAADAPWYVKNSVLYRDLELPTISKFMREHFFDVASSHPNPLAVSAVSYKPPPPYHFCKRPRNVLLDPHDDLTVEVEKLIELNKTDGY